MITSWNTADHEMRVHCANLKSMLHNLFRFDEKWWKTIAIKQLKLNTDNHCLPNYQLKNSLIFIVCFRSKKIDKLHFLIHFSIYTNHCYQLFKYILFIYDLYMKFMIIHYLEAYLSWPTSFVFYSMHLMIIFSSYWCGIYAQSHIID